MGGRTTLTAELTFFDTALRIVGDAATLDAAVSRLPPWAGAWENREDGAIWLWLNCKDVPEQDQIDQWVATVTERVGA